MEAPATSRPAAPAVVAVVISRNPGPWFDEALAALAAQDYENLSVLVVDAASETDPTPRVATVLPDAYVRRLETNPGYGAAANGVLDVVEGAAFYCFLHDDAAPAPSAIRLLVGEALRSNAGVVGPKLVLWDDERRLLQVGEAVDKMGERAALVEPGELDQEQHDAVRDVFVVPGACTLVRADLFSAIGGFDPGIDLLNDDLSLCWRAHVAGARVLVVPDAVVRHVEALGDRSPVEQRRRRLQRHRIRTMLTCYSPVHLVRVLPQAAVVALLEVVYSLCTGRARQARDIVAAWRWNLRRFGQIRQRRRQIQAFRTVPDREVRRFQAHGSVRLSAFLRGQTGRADRGERASDLGRTVVTRLRDGEYRWPIAAWVATAVIVTIGSRYLLTEPIAAVGGFAPFDLGPGELLGRFVSGWRDVGLGSATPAPSAFGALAGAGTVFLGAMGMLRRVLVLGPLVAGLVGAYTLTRPTGSRRTQAVCLVAYASAPLVYSAVGETRWGAIASYGAAPWILAMLAKAARWAPFTPPVDGVDDADADAVPGAGAGVKPVPAVRRTVRLGLLLTLLFAFSPATIVVVVLLVAGLALGSLVAARPAGVARVVAVGAGSTVIAVLLNLPWALEFVLPGARWEMVVGQRGQEPEVALGELLRFGTGPVGGDLATIGLLVAALLPLLIGRGWRFDWAVRAWTTALLSFGAAWAAEADALPFELPPAEVLLVPALLGLAVATALGAAAFDLDLRAYRFGWRQIAGAVAGLAFLVGAVPTLLDAGNGRWYLPADGLEVTFAFLDDEEPGFRVLWLGDPLVLPTDGYALDDELAYATSTDGLPSITDQWSGAPAGSTELLEDVLQLATEGQTERLGRLLAPMAVRYVVVPSAQAPAPLGGVRRPAPERLLDVLDAQLDLREVPLNPAYTVFRNEAALSTRSLLAATAGDATTVEITQADLEGAEPVLPDEAGATTFEGPLVGGSRVLHSAGVADGWELVVDGVPAAPVKLFGWADGYDVTNDGDATLRFDTNPLRYAVIAFQLLFLAVAVAVAARRTRVATGDPPPAVHEADAAPPDPPADPEPDPVPVPSGAADADVDVSP